MTTTSQHLPWAIAHRGARDEAPENTRSAFERALAYPIDGIELDVRMSSDGVLVIHHDETLGRRFFQTGDHRRVAEMSFAQLNALDWGGWYDKAFDGESLATLDQVLTWFGRHTRLMIEIKSDPEERRSGRIRRITQMVIDVLDKAGVSHSANRIHLLSFDADVLSLAHELAPQWRYVFNLPEKDPNIVMGMPDGQLAHLWAVDVEISCLSPELVAWSKKRNLHIFTYTCNTPRQVDKALVLGVDAILSDKPGWLTRYLGRSDKEPQ